MTTANIGAQMNTHCDNFKAWYKKPLELLYPDRDAGFAILLIAFPLLERFLRKKKGLTSSQDLSNSFFDELATMFPVLGSGVTARQFWQIYRNGLLHEVTLSRQNRGGTAMPTGWLSHDKPMVSVESGGDVWVNPVDFAKRVIAVIEADFGTFEGSPTVSDLPTVKPLSLPLHGIALGTNVGP